MAGFSFNRNLIFGSRLSWHERFIFGSRQKPFTQNVTPSKKHQETRIINGLIPTISLKDYLATQDKEQVKAAYGAYSA